MNEKKIAIILESLADTIKDLREEVALLRWERDELRNKVNTLQKSNESIAHQLDFEKRKGADNG